MSLRLDQTCEHCDTMPGIAAEALAATVAHDAAPSPKRRQTALRLQSLVRRRQECGRHAAECPNPGLADYDLDPFPALDADPLEVTP